MNDNIFGGIQKQIITFFPLIYLPVIRVNPSGRVESQITYRRSEYTVMLQLLINVFHTTWSSR